jgi:hypothetical protein
MTYPWTGRLSYSLLKTIASSPAHFLHACKVGVEVTPSMRLGTCTHYSLLGGRLPPIVYDGDRRGNEWECLVAMLRGSPMAIYEAPARTGKAWSEFKSAHRDVPIYLASERDAVVQIAAQVAERGASERDLYTASERELGETIATAVRELPHNANAYRSYIDGGQYETPIEWEMGGFECATRGVDVLHPSRGLIVDYKTTRDVAEWALARQARALHYAEQIAMYDAAVTACLWSPREHAIVATCTSDPYCTVVLPIRPAALQIARGVVDGWLATLRDCLDSDTWPGPPGFDLEPAPWDIQTTGECDLPEASP